MLFFGDHGLLAANAKLLIVIGLVRNREIVKLTLTLNLKKRLPYFDKLSAHFVSSHVTPRNTPAMVILNLIQDLCYLAFHFFVTKKTKQKKSFKL